MISPRRALPDYDGIPYETSAGEGALWIPRVAFFPVYLVTEYVVRWPLGVVVSAADRGHWVEVVNDFFRFGPDKKMMAFPTALIDFGLRTSVGAQFSWEDVGGKGNTFRAHAGFGGVDWLRLTMGFTGVANDATKLKLRAEGWRRPDGLFYGIGASSRQEDEARYAADILGGAVALEVRPTRSVVVLATTGVRHIEFPRRGVFGDEPTLRQRIASGALAKPPGFAEGWTTLKESFDVALDSRAPRPESGSGVRVELHGDIAVDAEHAVTTRWAGYGGSIGGYLDLTGKNRVLSLQASARFADPLGEGEIPFLELTTLGGDGPMRGFLPGRLYGRSQAVAKLEYRYPVWAFLDATMQAAVGNVFDAHLEDFRPEALRTSLAFGFRTVGERDQSLDIMIGAGTRTFEQGGEFDSLRLVIGTSTGF